MKRPLLTRVWLAATFAAAPLVLAPPSAAQIFPQPPVPPGNPITPAKARLGKALFWDEQLSSTRTVACGTCHIPAAGGSDPRSQGPSARVHPGLDGLFGTDDDAVGSPGVPRSRPDSTYEASPEFGLDPQVTRRKAPSMINAAFSPQLFWDGRAENEFFDPWTGQLLLPFAAALENQALGPPLSTAEMSHLGRDLFDLVERVIESRPLALASDVPAPLAQWIGNRSYPQLFAEAFGTPEVTPARFAMALATYQRTLVSAQTPWDAFVQGVPGALTPEQDAGRLIFFDPANGCASCHQGPTFSDDLFHYIGVRPPPEDLGRFEVTGIPGHRGQMRTPGLRNVSLRGPYFHDGSAATLEDVVDFYDRGGDFDAPNKDPRIVPLNLSAPKRALLVTFLREALLDPRVELEQFPFDRPTLYSEGARVPTALGAGTPGSGGFVPDLVALEPPKLGNPELTLAVQRARGGAPSFVLLGTNGDPAGTFRRGVFLHVSLVGGHRLERATLEGTGPGGGFGSLVLALPPDPLLAGRTFHAQWLVLDPAAPQGLAASEAARFELF